MQDIKSDFQEKVEANLPKGLEPDAIRLQPQGTTPTGEYRLLLEAMAKAYLEIWGDLLEEAERERIRLIKNPDQILVLGMSANRVELTVEERFVGEPPDRVIVRTGAADGDCGIPFEQGNLYVVVATKGRGGLYYTGVCSQTAPIDYEPPTLEALRDWKRGEEFPRTVYGIVRGWTKRGIEDSKQFGPLAGQLVRLLGETQSYEAVTNPDGYFEWSNLPAGKYELHAERPDWTMTSRGSVDLQLNRCVSRFVTLEENQLLP